MSGSIFELARTHSDIAKFVVIVTVALAGASVILQRPPEAYIISALVGLAVYIYVRLKRVNTMPKEAGE